ncbi:MAG: ArsR/SmtB family transcription factor [Paracoccaceae bacterium]
MNDTTVATALSALGHEARLGLFRLLVRAGPDGLNIGELGRLLGLPASTLSHHLGTLVAAGLVRQERRGREVVNRAEFERMRAVLDFVDAECCAGIRPADDVA